MPKLQRAAAAGVERVEELEVLQQKCNYSLVLVGRGAREGFGQWGASGAGGGQFPESACTQKSVYIDEGAGQWWVVCWVSQNRAGVSWLRIVLRETNIQRSSMAEKNNLKSKQ